MTNSQRKDLLMWCSGQLDYWTPRKDTSLEGEEQYAYYTNMMKFIVTEYNACKIPVIQSGANLVFPCL